VPKKAHIGENLPISPRSSRPKGRKISSRGEATLKEDTECDLSVWWGSGGRGGDLTDRQTHWFRDASGGEYLALYRGP